MIHNISKEPLKLKKISVRTWTLKSQLKSILKNHVINVCPEDTPLSEVYDLVFNYHQELPLFEYFGDKIQTVNDDEPMAAKQEQEQEQEQEQKQNSEVIDDTPKEENKEEKKDPEATANEDTNEEEKEASNKDAAQSDENKAETETAPSILSSSENKTNSEDDESNIIYFSPINPEIDESEVGQGKTFLSDINMQRISFFSTKSYIPGQSIMIHFMIPNTFTISAEVLWCKIYYYESRIISEVRPKYRVYAKFTFSRVGERTLLRKFVTSIEPEKVEKDA